MNRYYSFHASILLSQTERQTVFSTFHSSQSKLIYEKNQKFPNQIVQQEIYIFYIVTADVYYLL